MNYSQKVEVRMKPFVRFAYGNKRRDKSNALEILQGKEEKYSREKDFYGVFRENLRKYEENKISENAFLSLHNKVNEKKKKTYEALSQKYLELKEDHGLIWEGRKNITCEFDRLHVQVVWFLRTTNNNQNTIIALNFDKEPLSHSEERGTITLLQIAVPEAAAAGVLNIQFGTLTTQTRINDVEREYLNTRAQKFLSYCK